MLYAQQGCGIGLSFVKKVQTYAMSLKEEGYPVLLVGDKDHPEVLAIRGYIKDDIIICQTEKQVRSLKIPKKIGIVAQTTQDYKNFKKNKKEKVKK